MSHHNLAHGNKWVPNEMTVGSVNVPLKLYCKKVVDNKISNFQGKHLQSLFLIMLFLIKAPTQVFSCEICKTLKHSYFEKLFTKINTPPWVFITFFELHKWYQIAQRISDCLTNDCCFWCSDRKGKFCSYLLPLALSNSCTNHKVPTFKKTNGKIQTKLAELIYVWTNV